MSGGLKAGLRGSLETDVRQELVCLTSPLQQASWRHDLPRLGPAGKLLPHTSPRSASDLLYAGMWRVKTKSTKNKRCTHWLIWKEDFVECLGGVLGQQQAAPQGVKVL